ncbi:MAG: acetyltransferase [Flavobacterium sp.]|nr:acetyltransferase [Flavobacterium sp.]
MKIFNFLMGRMKNLPSVFIQRLRILKYKLLSECKKIRGKPKFNQPVLFMGQGEVVFEEGVEIGVKNSPAFLNSYAYIEARNNFSKIFIGKDSWINNNFCVIAEGEEIRIGERALIGHNVQIFDSDFHCLSPFERRGGPIKRANVIIGKNVFIGSNVKILKGVEIGDNCVIANGAIVTKNIPANMIACGTPAKPIKPL